MEVDLSLKSKVQSLKLNHLNCSHEVREKRFIDYFFTEERFALFCKKCNKQLTEPK